MNYKLFLQVFFYLKNPHKCFPPLTGHLILQLSPWRGAVPQQQRPTQFRWRLDSDWNPKGQTSRTARRSQCTFRNYNRSCWLPPSRKSGLYLRFACTQSRSSFSFNHFKSQFSPQYYQTASLLWGEGARCAKSLPKNATEAQYEPKFKGLNFKSVPKLL